MKHRIVGALRICVPMILLLLERTGIAGIYRQLSLHIVFRG